MYGLHHTIHFNGGSATVNLRRKPLTERQMNELEDFCTCFYCEMEARDDDKVLRPCARAKEWIWAHKSCYNDAVLDAVDAVQNYVNDI